MPRVTIDFHVEMDDGKEHSVVVDQRDFAAWEAQDLPDRDHTRMRFLAWSAMTRQGLTIANWQEFNSRECAEVIDPPGAEEEPDSADERLDPGRKGRSAGN